MGPGPKVQAPDSSGAISSRADLRDVWQAGTVESTGVGAWMMHAEEAIAVQLEVTHEVQRDVWHGDI